MSFAERRVDRLAAKANRAANAGKTQKELRLHEKFVKADDKLRSKKK